MIEVYKQYKTKTEAICQENGETLNNRIVQVTKINNDYEIICLVSFDKDEVKYLPFSKDELIEL